MCRQAQTQKSERQTMHQPLHQREQIQENMLQMPIEQSPAQEYRQGSRLAENIRRQAESAPDGIRPPMGEMAQQSAEERAALTKAQRKTLKRQQKERERLRKQQEEERIQREREQEQQRQQEALRQHAQQLTLQSSVVSGVTPEQWRQHGGASYHQMMPPEEAQRYIAASNGCLYAKPAADGLVELRATLPEKVEIEGRQIPFRKSYNLLIKAIARSILDEDGGLQKDAVKFVNRLMDIMTIPDSSMPLERKKTALQGLLRPVLQTMYKSKKQAERAGQDIAAMMGGMKFLVGNGEDTSIQSYGLPAEILGNLEGFVDDLQKMSATRFAADKERLRQDLQRDVDSGTMTQEQMQQALDSYASPQLMEQRDRMQRVMQEDGYSAEEQQTMLRNVTSMYADLDAAKLEFLQLRDLDENGQEVYLPNACSANAAFFQALQLLQTGERRGLVAYHVSEHMKENPMLHMRYLLEHFRGREKERTQLLAIRQRLERGDAISSNDWNFFKESVDNYWKYEYHAAGNIGQVDDIQITIEEFAAETVQYTVSPFSSQSAVGLYRGERRLPRGNEIQSSGMVNYYNYDSPFPQEDALKLAEVKQGLLRGTLPGGSRYVRRKQNGGKA